MIGVWWAGGDRGRPGRRADAAGYKALSFNGAGADFPFIDDVITHATTRACRSSPASRIGDMLYNRGMYNSI